MRSSKKHLFSIREYHRSTQVGFVLLYVVSRGADFAISIQSFNHPSNMPVVAAPPAGGPVGPSTFDKSTLSTELAPGAAQIWI
jgi:hypothetical protein